jgi:hypothetical protein
LSTDRARYSKMRAATVGLAMPNSTEHIIREIAALIPGDGASTAIEPIEYLTAA